MLPIIQELNSVLGEQPDLPEISPEEIGNYEFDTQDVYYHVDQQVIAKIFDNLNTENARYHVLYGGRDSGKSWGVADYIITRCLQKWERVLCTRQYQSSIATSSYRMLRDTIRRRKLEDYFIVTQDTIRCITTGAEIIFKGLQAQTIDDVRSTEGVTICWVEEAHSIAEESWRVLIPTIRAPGSKIIVTFNPDLETDPTYVRFVLNTPPRCVRTFINWDDNPFISPDILEEIAYDMKWDYDMYLHVWKGMCRHYADSQIFAKKYEVKDFVIPEGVKRLYYGADWGFAKDPTAGVEVFIWDQCLYVNQEVYGIGVELDEIPQLFSKIYGMRRWEILADNSRPETISYLNKHRFEVRDFDQKKFTVKLNVKAADKWPGSVEDGIEYMKKFKRIIIHPRCKHTIQEFHRYAFKVDKKTNEVLPIVVSKHDHCIDAIRYALGKLIQSKSLDWLRNV